MSTREELQARLAELDEKIANYPHCGAALTAMDEERRGIMRALAALEKSRESAMQELVDMGYGQSTEKP